MADTTLLLPPISFTDTGMSFNNEKRKLDRQSHIDRVHEEIRAFPPEWGGAVFYFPTKDKAEHAP